MFEAGETIFVPGAAGEPTALVQRVFATPGAAITTSFAPGVNRLSAEMIGPGTRVTGLFMQASLAAAQRTGAFRHLPLSYAAMLKLLRHSAPFDACVVQVSPPDGAGMCSLGPSAEFTPEVLRRARRVVAVVNPLVPRLANGCGLPWSAVCRHIEADTPLATYDAGAPDATSDAIAANVARYVGDEATLQVGLGKAPHALMRALHGRRRLRLHSGMISDGVIGLAESGALDASRGHVTTAVLGTPELYRWIADRPEVAVLGVERVHAPAVLAAIDGFVAVNSALDVDLFGQCNLETSDGRAVSGVGGAADFARAARLSPGGVSVVALPSTFGAARRSRIRARLGEDGLASLARTEIDVIVTEHGAADLRGRSVHERAEAIIEVAAPEARADLADRWREIAARL